MGDAIVDRDDTLHHVAMRGSALGGTALGYLGRRVLQMVMVVWVVTTIVFLLVHAAPGDPFGTTIDNPNITPAIRARWVHDYGLDRPLFEQYWRYLAQVVRGNFGWSFSMHRPVLDVLRDALPNTIVLTTLALAVGFLIGIIVGVFQASRAGSLADRTITKVVMTIAGLPDFWIGLIMMLAFAYWLPIFPVAGVVDPVMHDYLSTWGQFTDRLAHLVLPVTTLALVVIAQVARHQRADLLRVLPNLYIQSARARGLSERRILYRHALRNALVPIVTLLGLSVPMMFTGAVFVERIYSWPGMGWTILNAVGARDYPLVTAGVIVASSTVALGSLIADVLYAWANPRVSHG